MPATIAKVTFVKRDINLWRKHSPFLTEAQMAEGIVMGLKSGREVAFMPTKDGRALRPVESAGLAEWKAMPYGTVVDAEVI